MIAREQSIPIVGFKGLDLSSPLATPGYTRELLNVLVSEGKVQGRGGVTFAATFGTAMSENIDALIPWVDDDASLTTTLLRIGATKVEKSTDGGAWSDITGTALTGAAGDRPQGVMFRDGNLYFCNEGQDRIRKYTGTGNTAEAASSTAPWAKAIEAYYGFLFALNESTDGTTFFPRRALYTEEPDVDWSLCEGNELNFNESPGAIMAMSQFGRSAAVVKEDLVVYLRWIGGPTRFSQEPAKGSLGTLAPISVQSLGEKGIIYLATDYALWVITNNEVIPVPPRVNDILKNDFHKPLVGNCRSCVVPSKEMYHLFFPLDSGGNEGRIQFNYRTGEFSYSTYPSHNWDAVATVRWTDEDPETIIGAVNATTYEMDTTAKLDQISATTNQSVTRRYDTDWLQYTNVNEGRYVQTASKFTGATLIFKANANTKCAISVAVDHKNLFKYRKVYNLRPVYKGDEYIAVRYDLEPIQGEWFNLRIEFLPSTTVNPTLHAGFMHFLPEVEKPDHSRTGGIATE